MATPERALELLLEMTRSLAAERSLNKALQLVTDTALQLLPGDHSSIRVLDQSRTELLSGARSGSGLGKRPVKHATGQGVAGWVVDHGEILRLDDAPLDPRFIPKANQGFEIRSMLAVPLWSAGDVVGVLAITSKNAATYHEEHELLASLLANCAVPPIEKARLARLAVTDAHTLTFNHTYLMPGIKAEMVRLGRSASLSLLLMDLDHFKGVNDRHGHAAGDIALRQFADRVRRTTRDNDIVVRRGGDEFVLIMPGTGTQSAQAVAERICSIMGQQAVDLPSGDQLRVTVSIGVATWTGEESAEQLERRADDAMYTVKQRGRNGVEVSVALPPTSEPPSTVRDGSD